VPDQNSISNGGPKARTSLTLEKGIRILDCFDVEHPGWNLVDLAARAGIARPTAYRLVKTLVELKYLARDPSTSTYRLGPGLMKATYLMLSHSELARIAHPFMEELAAETTESACLGVWLDNEVLIVDVVLAPRPFKLSVPIGLVMPSFGTAHSKVFLAFGPEHIRRRALAQKLERRTEYTIVDPRELDQVLDQVKREGVAFGLQEWEVGTCAAAAPIFGSSGQIAAALAVVTPNERFGPAEMRTYVGAVRQTAARISERLGYQPAALT
jgi:DNA-binding IclR family transcriptional regulator